MKSLIASIVFIVFSSICLYADEAIGLTREVGCVIKSSIMFRHSVEKNIGEHAVQVDRLCKINQSIRGIKATEDFLNIILKVSVNIGKWTALDNIACSNGVDTIRLFTKKITDCPELKTNEQIQSAASDLNASIEKFLGHAGHLDQAEEAKPGQIEGN